VDGVDGIGGSSLWNIGLGQDGMPFFYRDHFLSYDGPKRCGGVGEWCLMVGRLISSFVIGWAGIWRGGWETGCLEGGSRFSIAEQPLVVSGSFCRILPFLGLLWSKPWSMASVMAWLKAQMVASGLRF
jgi:hypothetical protein